MSQPERPLRWGIAATGRIARAFARDMTATQVGRVVAVGSRSAERARKFAEEYDLQRFYSPLEKLAESEEIDAVYVPSPPLQHLPDALLFINAGKHVLVEKPFTASGRQAVVMAAAAHERQVFLMEAMWSRFLPAYDTLRSLLENGRIGDPMMVDAEFGFQGSPTQDWSRRLFRLDAAGGALLDLGVYPIQLAMMALGRVDRVQAVGRIGPTGVDTSTCATLGFAEGGLATLRTSITTALPNRAVVTGTAGTITLSAPMHCTNRLEVRVGGSEDPQMDVIECPIVGGGLQYQALEVERRVGAGFLESDVMPLRDSIAVMDCVDRIRAQIGLENPE